MQSDDLIKKLLKAAAICEIAFLAIYAIAFLFINRFGISDIFFESVSLCLPDLIKIALTTCGFFGIWYLLKKAFDPRCYTSLNGALLAAYVVISNIISVISNYAFTYRLNHRYSGLRVQNVDYLARMVRMRNYSSVIGYISSAAVILLWIAFGMEWYRDRLIKEQTELAMRAAEQNMNTAPQTENTAAMQAESSADPEWDAYRSTLVKQQAAEEPSQEYKFDNKH